MKLDMPTKLALGVAALGIGGGYALREHGQRTNNDMLDRAGNAVMKATTYGSGLALGLGTVAVAYTLFRGGGAPASGIAAMSMGPLTLSLGAVAGAIGGGIYGALNLDK